MTRAFDMSRYQRVIATSDTRIRGSFVVHGAEKGGVFAVDPLDVTLYSEDGSWGRVVKYGYFEVDLDDNGVPTLGRIFNEATRADIEDVRDLINETLALVVAAFESADGKASSDSGNP